MSSPKTCLVDANILLRYLRNDEPKQSPAVKRLVEQAGKGEVALEIPLIAIAETVTLQSYYEVEPRGHREGIDKDTAAPG